MDHPTVGELRARGAWGQEIVGETTNSQRSARQLRIASPKGGQTGTELPSNGGPPFEGGARRCRKASYLPRRSDLPILSALPRFSVNPAVVAQLITWGSVMQDHSSETGKLIELARQGEAEPFSRPREDRRDRLPRTLRLRLDPRLAGRVKPSDGIQQPYTEACRPPASGTCGRSDGCAACSSIRRLTCSGGGDHEREVEAGSVG